MISFRTMLSVLSAFFFLFLSLTPGANAYRIPSRQTDGDQPLGFYMGFSESGGYFPIISGMNHLMVGDKDDDGSRKPRRNCIFYVNQRPPMNENDPNWAKKRALQFSELMNLAAAGGDYHTLYDVFNLEDAFNAAHPGPMSEALEAGLKRAWFQTTSEAIWITHERPALWRSGRITQVVEVRPSDIGRAYHGGGSSVYNIPHYFYRDGQPPGSTPPRKPGSSEVPKGINVPKENPTQTALDAIGDPDVSGDPGAPPEICPGYNYGIMDLGFDVGSGKEGYAVLDSTCNQVAGAITKNPCTDPLFSCSPPPIKIVQLHLFGQNYACRPDSRSGRCSTANTDVQFCCRNDGN